MNQDANGIKEIPLSKIKMVMLLIGSVLFVAAGIWFIKNPEIFRRSPTLITIIGYLSIVFFGIGALFIVNKLFDTRPGFVIDANGIVDNSSMFSVGFIPWADITGLSIIHVNRQKLIMVKVEDVEGYIHRQPNALARRTASMSYRMYGSPVSVSAVTLKCSFEELYRLIDNGWKASGFAK